ncbi:UNVERIFIED_CONTAM: Ethylene-insensitive protein 2 [Sesamum latifolium]|uniref:Ethylene-insensitive protein 2 n=1 Tax=Sesamum latifolium TaxID=2727402 RepID=A0AAW2VE76_9LAMI
MESKTVTTDYQPSTRGRMLAAAGPVLWIAVSYVDPGKWAAAVDGGARFGFDLALLVLIINCAAILCHYLSARIAIATGKDLAQICSEEYDDVICVLLGIEAEVSMIALDLTMVLGTAYGLNVIVGIDLFNCVFLTGFDAVVFPILASFLVFRSSIASISLLVVMFFSNQLIALTWSLGRQVVAQDLFRLEIPGWLHRATIRIIAIIPALYCVWNSGAEGIFQLLVFTQVVIALLLPSSVIPLFRVASSRSIMGPYKVSRLVEFSALVSFVGMLGLKIVFVIEMIFGSSEWVSSLKWNIGSAVPIPYLTLLMAALASSV